MQVAQNENSFDTTGIPDVGVLNEMHESCGSLASDGEVNQGGEVQR